MSRARRIGVAVAVVAAVGSVILTGALIAGGSGGDADDNSAENTDGARTVQPGAPGEPGRELTDEEAAAVGSPEHNAADTAFMQDMVVHHQQALDMTALVAGHTERQDLPLLAERITVSQEAELELIDEWLTARGEDVPGTDSADHQDHGLMPGMATADQLAQLDAARGATFDRLFVELMIVHHQGAVTMVANLYADGGGLEPAADKFARDVEADQNIEILRMQDLLATLP